MLLLRLLCDVMIVWKEFVPGFIRLTPRTRMFAQAAQMRIRHGTGPHDRSYARFFAFRTSWHVTSIG